MQIKDQDFRLVAASQKLGWLTRILAEMETDFASKRLKGVTIDRPVFVTGLARSGTTIILTLLSKADDVATHRYRDFPFLQTPILWNWFQDKFSKPAAPTERAHGDRIEVSGESPEAYEEPVWSAYLDWLHDPSRVHTLEAGFSHAEFEEAFQLHLRKILAIRDGRRYVSKGNYNVTRIGYLAKLFPDAHFVVPVREPLSHVHSLVQQHRRFSAFSDRDPRVPVYLAAAGHYEFGPQRVAIQVKDEEVGKVAEAWNAGEDYRGYARLWAHIYSYVDLMQRTSPEIEERLTIVRYEDLCIDPRKTVAELCRAAQLQDSSGAISGMVGSVSAPKDPTASIDDKDREAVMEETAEIAQRFGYSPCSKPTSEP